ncbi:MAG: aspartate--tRNA ligase, partial [Bacteroidetes bacterium]|nr:aspartate--tRNA ligase [Bacteroidota bacterium]
MYRTHTCGALRIKDINQNITLSGWVQTSRNFGELLFIDIRDRYGITQIVFNKTENPDLFSQAEQLGREYVVQIKGNVVERSNKNPKNPTGEIEIIAEHLVLLSASKLPPFTIENDTDGGD